MKAILEVKLHPFFTEEKPLWLVISYRELNGKRYNLCHANVADLQGCAKFKLTFDLERDPTEEELEQEIDRIKQKYSIG